MGTRVGPIHHRRSTQRIESHFCRRPLLPVVFPTPPLAAGPLVTTGCGLPALLVWQELLQGGSTGPCPPGFRAKPVPVMVISKSPLVAANTRPADSLVADIEVSCAESFPERPLLAIGPCTFHRPFGGKRKILTAGHGAPRGSKRSGTLRQKAN